MKPYIPQGFGKPYLPDDLKQSDLEDGYCDYEGIDLNDMFGAFNSQCGIVGGEKTTDDYSPEGSKE